MTRWGRSLNCWRVQRDGQGKLKRHGFGFPKNSINCFCLSIIGNSSDLCYIWIWVGRDSCLWNFTVICDFLILNFMISITKPVKNHFSTTHVLHLRKIAWVIGNEYTLSNTIIFLIVCNPKDIVLIDLTSELV